MSAKLHAHAGRRDDLCLGAERQPTCGTWSDCDETANVDGEKYQLCGKIFSHKKKGLGMRGKTWRPSTTVLRGLFFIGAPKLLRELDQMIRRPWLWWRENLLPALYLVIIPGQESPLPGIEDRLRRGKHVVYSRVDSRNYRADPTETTIGDLLSSVVADLSSGGHHVRRIMFPHYSLALWLQNLASLDPEQPDQLDERIDEELKKFIRSRSRLSNAATDATTVLAKEFPWYIQLSTSWFPLLRTAVMRKTWRPPRWFAKHDIGEKYGQSFKLLSQAFISRATNDQNDHQVTQAEINTLLVDAFLEDIRRSYRRWTLLGIGRRRTSYPVLLVDDATSGTPSLALVKLINISRIATCRRVRQRPDPYCADHLLVVARGDEAGLDELIGDHAVPDGVELFDVANTHTALADWGDRLHELSRSWSWILPLKIPSIDERPGDRDILTGILLPVGRTPIMTLVAPLILVVAATTTLYSTYRVHCGTWFWQLQLERQSLNAVRDQCVGLAPSGYHFFSDLSNVEGLDTQTAEQLKAVEERIHHANQDIEKDPKHLTAVYLSVLTPIDAEGYVVELEQLRGIAIAQEENRRDRPVRILFANAGYDMNYGKKVAQEISIEAERDPSLVGVIGLAFSRQGTREAMVALGDKKLPMIGTSISATALATTTTQYYYQVAPTNEREAQVAAHRANQLETHVATIYYSDDPNDLYSNDLKDQATRAFEHQKISVSAKSYRVNPTGGGSDVSLLGRDACSIPRDGVAFYAGRADQLLTFLNGMKNTCQGNYPKLISGDSATRFVRTGELRQFPGLTLEYLSFASSLAFEPDCNAAAYKIGFLVDYRHMFGGECIRNRDSYAMLAYDALLLFTQAARNSGDQHPTRDAILRGLGDISEKDALQGASGVINFPRSGSTRSVPQDKAILMLQAIGDSDSKRVLLCGQIDKASQSTHNDCG